MRKLLVLLLVISVSFIFVACSSGNMSSNGEDHNIDNDYIESNNDIEEAESKEDNLSGIWSVIEGGDDHTIIIANGNIQIIDGPDNDICKYTKPAENIFRIEFCGDVWEFKYENGYLYRYENGKADGYVYERTAYNSNY